MQLLTSEQINHVAGGHNVPSYKDYKGIQQAALSEAKTFGIALFGGVSFLTFNLMNTSTPLVARLAVSVAAGTLAGVVSFCESYWNNELWDVYS